MNSAPLIRTAARKDVAEGPGDPDLRARLQKRRDHILEMGTSRQESSSQLSDGGVDGVIGPFQRRHVPNANIFMENIDAARLGAIMKKSNKTPQNDRGVAKQEGDGGGAHGDLNLLAY